MLRLSATRLGKRFGRRLLFRDLSLMLREGESLAVTGANGAGKSTLLKILAGVMRPSAGSLQLDVNGGAVSPIDHPLRVGLVAPYLNVYDGFSPRENLGFIAKVRGLRDAERAIADVLELVELADRSNDVVSTFSSGMKQRVKFGAALLHDPPVILLDEPRVNLDAAGLEMVDRVVERHRVRGGILVIATNDSGEAAHYGQSIRIEDFR